MNQIRQIRPDFSAIAAHKMTFVTSRLIAKENFPAAQPIAAGDFGNDAFGFGATWVRFSQQGSAPYDRPGEVAWEAFYKFRVNRLLTAGPDLQFIQSPGGLRSQRDCLLLTPRITIDF